MDAVEELESVRDVVLSLLREDERCRNDDKWLTYRVMRYYTKIFIPFEDFERIPTFESIRRIRQKIQNDERLWQPTRADVFERRCRRESQYRQYFGGGK